MFTMSATSLENNLLETINMPKRHLRVAHSAPLHYV